LPNQNDTIKSCVVKIEDNGAFCQSGLLWLPAEESETAYVFTVTHGIKEYTALQICFWRSAEEISLPVEKVLFHPDREIDVAILTIPNRGLPVSPYTFLALDNLEPLVNRESKIGKLQVNGYPELHCLGDYPGPNQQHHFPCAVENFYESRSTQTFMAFYDRDARISETDPDAELKGFSGGGLFATLQEAVFLCGIYRGIPTEAAHNRDFTVLSLRTIQEICSAYSLPLPNFQPLIPAYLRKHLGICQRELGSDHILKDCLQGVSKCWFTELIQTSCGHCAPCDYSEHFYLCERFQQQLLNSSALISYHNAVFDEHETLKVKKGEVYHDVRVICSDIRPARVSELIQALKQDYLGKNKLAENTLILWASKEGFKRSAPSCTRAVYQNIISDIAKARFATFDFTDVNEAPERLAVMNVQYILDEMETDSNAFSNFINEM
jgi:hypothetical protein